eukprot:gnl/Spiro4/3213_TR1561_c0_g1_i1.p1 gnl/Spiro4/3213_TR1561_c0_g1~~gnl/Spiro4/3213_TR1561_c0_g1_i1.p1  ORF type:complete len:314 (+),score=-47.64 gnl/Spiro4/3213_TR1561_c0_g1_i1:83-1024(+)
MTGILDMSNNRIINVGSPSVAADAINLTYLQNYTISKPQLGSTTLEQIHDISGTAWGDMMVYNGSTWIDVSNVQVLNYLALNQYSNVVFNKVSVNTLNPVSATDLTTKYYVDNYNAIQDTSMNILYVKKAGDAMNGNLDISNNKITAKETKIGNWDISGNQLIDYSGNISISTTTIIDSSNNTVTIGKNSGNSYTYNYPANGPTGASQAIVWNGTANVYQNIASSNSSYTYKNLLINGDMSINQYGLVSYPPTGISYGTGSYTTSTQTSYFSVDRWVITTQIIGGTGGNGVMSYQDTSGIDLPLTDVGIRKYR